MRIENPGLQPTIIGLGTDVEIFDTPVTAQDFDDIRTVVYAEVPEYYRGVVPKARILLDFLLSRDEQNQPITRRAIDDALGLSDRVDDPNKWISKAITVIHQALRKHKIPFEFRVVVSERQTGPGKRKSRKIDGTYPVWDRHNQWYHVRLKPATQ